jgi:alpha-methylacyl-CoA racemase
LTGASDPVFDTQMNQREWPRMKERFTALFKTRSRDEWCAVLEGTDVCFAPVLDMAEAPAHPHNRARGTFIEVDGVTQPAPAPRFSRTPGEVTGAASKPGADSAAILADWGWSGEAIAALRAAHVI